MSNLDLEIILITYNRLPLLKRTMGFLFDNNSPVKNFPITVLDNCSTDGTSEYLQELANKHKNIKHIRHTRNIGGNANIARAFEIATKEYFWVLADDDDYDFTHWDEVEKAISKKPGLIVVNTQYANKQKELIKLFRRLTFLPSCIYNIKLLDDSTISNVYDSVPSWFPHLAVICKAINEKVPVHICKHNIVLQSNINKDGYSASKDIKGLSPCSKNNFFDIGYLNSLEMITDKKQKEQIAKWFSHKPNFFRAIRFVCRTNLLEHNNCLSNLVKIWDVLSLQQRMQFVSAICMEMFFYYLKYPKYRKRKTLAKKNEKSNL